MKVTGIILAGGKSSRMGSDKGLIELCGKPLISYAISSLSAICDRIIISSSSNSYEAFGFEVIGDEFPGIGPMGGIYSALKKSSTEKNLVLSCDLPFVSAGLLSFILNNSDGYEVAVPCEGDLYYEPLCAFYRHSVLDKMVAFIHERNYKLPDLFEKVSINKLKIDRNNSLFHEHVFMNINSKHELTAAEKLMNTIK